MKSFISFVRILIFSNLFVSFCVVAFTHTTYIIFNLPKDNLPIVLSMVFCFTFFTYNGQRLFRLRQKLVDPENIGDRLKWVIKYKVTITLLTALFGLIGLIFTYFISIDCWLLLVPMGAISIFYVLPTIPFQKNSPSLRKLPYLKIFCIGLVWSLIIIGLPILDTPYFPRDKTTYIIALIQNLFFVVAITLPFDIRDLSFDTANNLKTIPQLLGIKKTIILSEILLISSIVLLYFLELKKEHFLALSIGYIITGMLILLTKESRKELFFSGLIESSVLFVYCGVLISEYLFVL
jgi:4-hydroxybenzoate polyprenyltransferase